MAASCNFSSLCLFFPFRLFAVIGRGGFSLRPIFKYFIALGWKSYFCFLTFRFLLLLVSRFIVTIYYIKNKLFTRFTPCTKFSERFVTQKVYNVYNVT